MKFIYEIDMSVPNKNGRIYKDEALKEAVANYQDRIDEGRAICQREPGSTVVDLEKASHRITEMGITPEGVLRIEFVSFDNEAGKILKELISFDAVDITTSGYGEVETQGDGTKLVKMVAFDGVHFVPKGTGSQPYVRK